MMTVETIDCPVCERTWPVVSEQGIHTELHDECHYCLAQRIIRLRDKRLAEVDYQIENCYVCAGVSPARERCVTCHGEGWFADEKQ